MRIGREVWHNVPIGGNGRNVLSAV